MNSLKIEKLDHFGRGITRINHDIYFIEGALPNDIVDIEVIKHKKNIYEAKVSKYIEKSNYHIDSICPYFLECGGCTFLNMDYKNELEFKEQKIHELVNKMLKKDVQINKIIYSDNIYNYRRKITIHGNQLGLYKNKSNDIVNIDKCYLVNEKINEILPRLKKYQEKTKCNIEEVTIKVSVLNEVMISLYGSFDYDHFLNEFKDIDVIYINNQLVSKKEYIKEKLFDKYFYVSNHSFFQVNTNMTENLYELVINKIKNEHYKNALDLYCGTGTIGILISDYVDKVTGIEEVKDAVEDANRNKELNNVDNINFICGKVENNIDSFKDIDLVIVDPPRSGLDNKTREQLLKINPIKIIYVSCDPATLMRDLNDLSKNYNIKEITPVDMFPRTYHCESITVLEKR